MRDFRVLSVSPFYAHEPTEKEGAKSDLVLILRTRIILFVFVVNTFSINNSQKKPAHHSKKPLLLERNR